MYWPFVGRSTSDSGWPLRVGSFITSLGSTQRANFKWTLDVRWIQSVWCMFALSLGDCRFSRINVVYQNNLELHRYVQLWALIWGVFSLNVVKTFIMLIVSECMLVETLVRQCWNICHIEMVTSKKNCLTIFSKWSFPLET